jgi:hypothetical protein
MAGVYCRAGGGGDGCGVACGEEEDVNRGESNGTRPDGEQRLAGCAPIDTPPPIVENSPLINSSDLVHLATTHTLFRILTLMFLCCMFFQRTCRLLVDINNHVPCVDVGTTFEERGPKEVKEQALRKRRLMGGSQMGLDQMESDGLQEVMACVVVEDTDYVERLEEQPKGAQLKVKEVVDISVYARGAYIG